MSAEPFTGTCECCGQEYLVKRIADLRAECDRITKLADDWSKELYTAKYGATLGRHYSEINEVLQEEHKKRLAAESRVAKLETALSHIKDEAWGDFYVEGEGAVLEKLCELALSAEAT
jgi:hypothetical protein